MKTLNKPEQTELDKVVVALRAAQEKLEDATAVYNQSVQTAYAAVQAAAEEYNAVVADAESFRDDVRGQMEDYFGDRSEKWHEGDAGSEYSEWMQAWDETFDSVEIPEPEELTIDGLDHADRLEGLPTEPGGC